jgi:hypothetical protein
MNRFKYFRKFISLISIFCLLSIQVTHIQAAMISNDQILKQAQHEVKVIQLISMLDKATVKEKLTQMGVDPIAARERVNQFTDEELSSLVNDIEALPAGGDFGGTLLTLFIIFVITDMLGATDIFPFVKNINR